MPLVFIDDLDDPRLAIYRNLKATNETRGSETFVVEGEKLVYRLLASRFPTDSILVTDRYESHHASQFPDDVPTYVIRHDQIKTLVGYHFHRGVLACGRRRAWPVLDSIFQEPGSRQTLVVCPTLDKPDNLGAILRIGEAFGVVAVLIGPSCPDPFSRRVIRVSMGAVFRLPVYLPDDLHATIKQLRVDRGFQVVAAESDDDDARVEPLDRVARTDRLALLLGGEAFGLNAEWVAIADRRVNIPMRPEADSLNVAVAAGILLYHFTDRSDG